MLNQLFHTQLSKLMLGTLNSSFIKNHTHNSFVQIQLCLVCNTNGRWKVACTELRLHNVRWITEHVA